MTSVAGSFNVSVSSGGPLSTFLTTNSTKGVFGALNSGNSNPTTAALASGALTNKQHKVLAAVSAAGKSGYSIGWNSTGTEPSTLSAMRGYGWLKLSGKKFDSSTKSFEGTYKLTPIGEAIVKRTGGGKVSTSGTSTAADVTASVTDTLKSQVGNLAGTLSSLGINISV